MSKKSTDPQGTRRYWLFKSEPEVYGFAALQRDRRTFWDGVRNYQARNLLRDEIAVGDGVLFYHSNAEPTAIVGIARVTAPGSVDPTQFERADPHFDPDSKPDDPRWFGVEIAPVKAFARPIARDDLKGDPRFQDMMVLARGARLSVQPVDVRHWRALLALGKVEENW